MKRKISLFLFAVIIIGILSGCEAQKSKQTLTVGIMPDFDSIPIIVAKEQGFFNQNVKIDIYKSPVDRDSALISGNMDGCISDVLAVCLERNGGFEAYITSKTNGKYGLVASQASGIKTAQDLKGKEIGLSINTIIEYVTDSILTKEGVDPYFVQKTAVPKIPSRLELLMNNQIAAVTLPEPYVSSAVSAGATLIGTSSDLGINPGVILFTKNAIDNKSEDIREFYRAYNKAVEYIAKNPKENYINKVISELGLPDSVGNAELPKYEKSKLPENQEVERAMQWLFDKKMIQKQYSYKELEKEI
ncbi:MAG: ABC transporter substrate-binding protein [Bacillota bacterium]|nr:ABC transporter substrate-binding protein [Bacillota bacterium]